MRRLVSAAPAQSLPSNRQSAGLRAGRLQRRAGQRCALEQGGGLHEQCGDVAPNGLLRHAKVRGQRDPALRTLPEKLPAGKLDEERSSAPDRASPRSIAGERLEPPFQLLTDRLPSVVGDLPWDHYRLVKVEITNRER